MFRNTLQSSARRVSAGATVAAVALGAVAATPGIATAAQRYEVQPGDTLALIAKRFGYDNDNAWRRLFNANNKVDNPDLIVPGQRLTIPEKGEKVAARKLPEPTPVASGTDTTTTAPASSAPAGS